MLALTFVGIEKSNINADNNQPTTQVATTTAKQKPKKKPKPKPYTGWKNKRYYVKGKYVVGAKKIKKKWYVFGKNGKVRKKTTKIFLL